MIEVAASKPLAEADDETLILADGGWKAVAQFGDRVGDPPSHRRCHPQPDGA